MFGIIIRFSSNSTDDIGHVSYKQYTQVNIVQGNKFYLLLE